MRVLAVRVNSYCILPNHFKAQMQHTTLRCALIANHYEMCQIKSASTTKCDHIYCQVFAPQMLVLLIDDVRSGTPLLEFSYLYFPSSSETL